MRSVVTGGAGFLGSHLCDALLARGDDMVLAWMTAWDTEGDADEWADALPALLPDAHVARRDRQVLAVVAPPGVAVEALGTALLARTRFAPGVRCS